MILTATIRLMDLIAKESIHLAARAIVQDKLVAFPTETVYGLGANALSAAAVKKIYIAKERPSDNPLIVHVSDYKQLTELSSRTAKIAAKLMNEFWPGPLTLILPASSTVPKEVTAGGNTVAVRMPNHPVALELIRVAGVPIAAPSANKSGRPSPTTAQHVLEDFNSDEIAFVIDAGSTKIGLESTVVDTTSSQPELLRAGAISKEQLEEVLGIEVIDSTVNVSNAGNTTNSSSNSSSSSATKSENISKLKSPGMRYKHYAPQATVVVKNKILADDVRSFASQVAVLQLNYSATVEKEADLYFSFDGDIEKMAAQLFSCFRESDHQGASVILVESVPLAGLGRAIMDRVQRAAHTD